MMVQNKTTFRQIKTNSGINETNKPKVNRRGNIIKLENTKAQLRKRVLLICLNLSLKHRTKDDMACSKRK